MTANQTLTAAPTASADRILILDSLRGIAVLGILMMNIPMFGYPRLVSLHPNLIDFTRANFYTWYGVEWFLEGSQRALFSMLFGAGMLLFIGRLENKTSGLMPGEYFFRRQLWLLLFGLFNAYVLLWPGDILFHYAILGMMLFAFRRLKPKYLLIGALVCLLFQTIRENADFYRDKALIHKGEMLSRTDTTKTPLTLTQKDELGEYLRFKQSTTKEARSQALQQIVRNVQGSYGSVYKQLSEFSFRVETMGMFHFMFFDVLLFMLVGMAFYKNGILLGRASATTYLLLFLGGMGFGLVLSYFRLRPSLKYNFDDYAYTKAVWFEFYEISRTLRSIGIFGGIMLCYKLGFIKWFFLLMRPVGQMAFTNYLAQSLICGIVFYGVGYGKYGKLEYHQLYYVVAAVWAVEIVWSHLWLRYFRFGPMEWLWRSLTYWKKQPLSKSSSHLARSQRLVEV